MTKELFRKDSYLRTCPIAVTALTERGGIVLDQTVFYPTGGGQPGDKGVLTFGDNIITIATTVKDKETSALVHVPAEDSNLPKLGDTGEAVLDWENRLPLMRMHTSLHLLCALIPFGVTGGQIGVEKSRLDFDPSSNAGHMPEKEAIQERLNELIAEDHPIKINWADEAMLESKPFLVRTMSVKPPKNASGLLRLVQIGRDGELVDFQPCGGTHVASTREISAVRVGKIENKGARNRRITLHLEDA